MRRLVPVAVVVAWPFAFGYAIYRWLTDSWTDDLIQP